MDIVQITQSTRYHLRTKHYVYKHRKRNIQSKNVNLSEPVRVRLSSELAAPIVGFNKWADSTLLKSKQNLQSL